MKSLAREANFVADAIAHVGLFIDNPHLWDFCLPHEALTVLRLDTWASGCTRDGTGRDGIERNGDYKFLSSTPTWKSGSGSISLPLVNLRFNYSFWIFRWNESEVDPNHLNQDHNPLPGIAHLLATSDDELSFESGCVPDQIHLAYMDGDDEMREDEGYGRDKGRREGGYGREREVDKVVNEK
ncbi:unnamed protein product [Malus baccata var. baccata]